jgi:hypothetical protein
MSRAPIERAIGRLALAFGLRRALRAARGGPRLSFLSGVGVGAGLMYLLTPRSPRPTPAPPRAQPSRRPRAPARAKPKR